MPVKCRDSPKPHTSARELALTTGLRNESSSSLGDEISIAHVALTSGDSTKAVPLRSSDQESLRSFIPKKRGRPLEDPSNDSTIGQDQPPKKIIRRHPQDIPASLPPQTSGNGTLVCSATQPPASPLETPSHRTNTSVVAGTTTTPRLPHIKVVEEADEYLLSFKQQGDLESLNNALESYSKALLTLPAAEKPYHTIAIKLIDSCFVRAFKTKNLAHIDHAVKVFHQTTHHLPSHLSWPPTFALALSRCYATRHSLTRRQPDLDLAISCYTATFRSLPPDGSLPFVFLKELGDSLATRFEITNQPTDLTHAIQKYREARNLFRQSDPNDLPFWQVLDCLGHRLLARSHLNGSYGDVEEAISYHQEALELRKDNGPFEAQCLRRLGLCHKRAFDINNTGETLNQASEQYLRATVLHPLPDAGDDNFLQVMAASFLARFEEIGDIACLHKAIELEKKVVSLRPENHAGHAEALRNLADSLDRRFRGTPNMDDINQAIELDEKVLDLHSQGQPGYVEALRCLGVGLTHRFTHNQDLRDINRAVEILKQVVVLRSEGHAEYANALCDAAVSLDHRYRSIGNIADINQAVQLKRQAVARRPEGHRDHAHTLRELAISLDGRFKNTYNIEDINEALELKKRVLALCPEGQQGHPGAVRELAISLDCRFRATGKITDINQALELKGRVPDMWPEGHKKHTDALREIAVSLDRRFSSTGDIADIDQAVALKRRVLSLRHSGFQDDPNALRELSISLDRRFQRTDDVADIDEAIQLEERVLAMRPEGRSGHTEALRGLSISLDRRFQKTEDSGNIDRAIELKKQVLSHFPAGQEEHTDALYELSISLQSRFQQSKSIADGNQLVDLKEKILLLCPKGHAIHAGALVSLAHTLKTRFHYSGANPDKIQEEKRRIVSLLREASADAYAGALLCLCIALEWVEVAEELSDPSVMEARTQTLLLVDKYIAQSFSLEKQCKDMLHNPRVRKARRVAVDAAASAIEGGRLELGVQLLEQGRSVVFRQLGQLRIQLDDIKVVVPVLGERFKSLSLQLEGIVSANHQPQAMPVKLEQFGDASEYRAARKHAEISRQWQEVVDQIRGINGFQSFLQPSSFFELQWAADAGPVIIVNISDVRSDAMIIVRQADRPILVPLPDATPGQVRRLADRFGAQAAKLNTNRAIPLLRLLWTILVEPISEELRGRYLNIPLGSRIWWCPTGDASRLPLHGAGPYVNGQPNMLELYTSSYIPNLSTLIRARKTSSLGSHSTKRAPDILLVGQAETPGELALPNTDAELKCIRGCATDATVLRGPQGLKESVISGLRTHSWVHLACHGHRDNEQPFSSHFSLHDGQLSLLDIVKMELPKAELAILSACHSAGANKDLPDECLHPAAGMMMAGFKGVVATMWALEDPIGPAFAKEFYKEMLGGTDHPKGVDHAATALRQAVMALGKGKGERTTTLMQKINWVHFGV